MISGPVVPRNLEGLWGLVRSDPERLESGLTLIEEGLVIDEDLRIDALARDAAHSPVFLFAVVGEGERSLPGRIMEAREWLQRNRGLLRQALPDQGMRMDREPRCMVIGFDFTESFLRHLSSIEVGDLVVHRFEILAIDDAIHVGVTQLLGAETEPRNLSAVPEGPSGEARAFGMQFVDLIKRIEPDCEIQGDRFSRSYFDEHGLMASLQVEGTRFRATSPCGASRRLEHSRDPAEIGDAVLRFHSAMTDLGDCFAGSMDESAPRLVAGGPSRVVRNAAVVSATASGGKPEGDEQEVTDLGSAVGHTLEGLRRRMSKLKVSQEEYEAFGDLGASSPEE